MPIFDFNVPFKDVSGTETDKKVWEALRDFLGSQNCKKEETFKYLHWYDEIKNGGTLELDELNRKSLLESIYNSEITFVYVKEQYKNVLDPKP
jgi:hypothetical protein